MDYTSPYPTGSEGVQPGLSGNGQERGGLGLPEANRALQHELPSARLPSWLRALVYTDLQPRGEIPCQ